MKALKIACFFAAGILVQAAMYGLSVLFLYGFSLELFITGVIAEIFGAITLGFVSGNIAKKLSLSRLAGTLSYIIGTFFLIISAAIAIDLLMPYYPVDSTGLGGLPNLGRNICLEMLLIFAIPPALNAIVQGIYGIYRLVKAKNNP